MEVPNKDIVFSPSRLQEAMGGMSMVDLAEKLGCAKSNISMYLSAHENDNTAYGNMLKREPSLAHGARRPKISRQEKR